VVEVVVVLDVVEVVDVVVRRCARTVAPSSDADSCDVEQPAKTNPPAATTATMCLPATLN
jgi:hypothetical protein